MGNHFTAKNPQFAERVRESFSQQKVMDLLGAELILVEAGNVHIGFIYQSQLTQQHGFIHAGIVSTLLDSACGYAAFSLMPAEAGVLSIEFKVNLLAPAKGERFIAEATVVKPGRTISVAEGTLFSIANNNKKKVATMTATMMAVSGRPDIQN